MTDTAYDETALISPQNGEVENMRDLHFRFLGLSRVSRLSVEVGSSLAALVRPGHADGLLEKVTALRRQMAFEIGLVVPGIQFLQTNALKPYEYAFKVCGIEAAMGEVLPDMLLAIMPNGEADLGLPGTPTREPIYGAPATWIEPTLRAAAVERGADVYDLASILCIHLTEVVRAYAADMLGRQEVRYMIDFVRLEHPDLVDALTPQPLSLGEIRGVLQSLLRERIPVRDLVTIFEALADVAASTRRPLHLVEGARLALARGLCRQHTDGSGTLHAITLEPRLESALYEAVARFEADAAETLEPTVSAALVRDLGRALEACRIANVHAVLVVHPPIRLFLRRLLEPVYPHLSVLSWSEVMTGKAPRPRIQIVATLRPPEGAR